MPFSPFHNGHWRSCWSGVRRWLTLWCHRVPAQDEASRREVVHAGTSGALVRQLREILSDAWEPQIGVSSVRP
jgi:hypothetical protein